MMALDCSRPPCATTGHSPSTHCPLICAVACSQPTKRRCHGRRGAAVSTSILSARAEKGGERLSQSSPSRPPGLPYALPCQLPPQRGQRALERLANKPSLLIDDRVESFDGLRRCAGVKLHRAAGAMDARRRLARVAASPVRPPSVHGSENGRPRQPREPARRKRCRAWA